jgi:hypothetical protein
VSFSFNGANEIATIVPATNMLGTTSVTINVSDGVSNVSQSFNVTVTPPTPPTLGTITSQTTPENTPDRIALNVTSPVTPLTNLTFSGSSTNTNLVTGVTFSFNGTSEIATINPVIGAAGTATVTISVSDPFSTNSQSFTLQVVPNVKPTLTATLASGVLKITFTGTPGATYTIQSSSNLETWTTAGTVTANATTGSAEYDVAVSNTGGAVFYRAVLLPSFEASPSITSLTCTIASGNGPFASAGVFSITTSGADYTLTPISGNVGPSSGTYTYTASGVTGTATMTDVRDGPGTLVLTFDSASSGTYVITFTAAPGASQTGTFTIP